MFPFTITFQSKIRKTNGSIDKIKCLSYLNNFIERHEGQEVYVSNDMISFKPKFRLFASGWHKFSLFEKAEFSLPGNTLVLKIFLYRLLIGATVMSVWGGYMAQQFFAGIFFFLALAGGNWVMALVKYRKMTRELSQALSNL